MDRLSYFDFLMTESWLAWTVVWIVVLGRDQCGSFWRLTESKNFGTIKALKAHPPA
jgi:hypothetical protein